MLHQVCIVLTLLPNVVDVRNTNLVKTQETLASGVMTISKAKDMFEPFLRQSRFVLNLLPILVESEVC